MVARYCTLFDRRYATRGLVMLESLERFRRPGDEITVLALDAETRCMVERLGKGRWRAVSVGDLEDRELTELKSIRPAREFCWTCTPAFSAWMVRRAQDGDIVVYLDADLMFFDDPRKLLDELTNGGSVLIHEHRFSRDRASYEPSSGRFNVGFVGFNVGSEARACADRWRAQTIERCELDPDNGYCGDQGYLNEWPTRYAHARVMRNIGGGVAPWNVNQYAVGTDGEVPTVDRVPVVFFHYHAFKTLFNVGLGVVAAEPAYGYEFSADVIRAFFRPYVRQLRKAIWAASGVGIRFEPDRKLAWRDVLSGIKRSRYILTI